MQFAHRLMSGLALAVLSVSSFATTIYTSSASFLAHVPSGFYTNTFTGLSDPSTGAFSGGGFAYTASAPLGIYVGGGFLGTNQVEDSLKITFTSGNIYAFGGNFFATDISDAFQPFSITLALSDGTVETFTPSSLANSYRGFVSDVAFSSVTISAPGDSRYPGVDNLTVAAVPEPSTIALMGLGLVVAVRVARRRAV
jgi:PEP-CTERM motif